MGAFAKYLTIESRIAMAEKILLGRGSEIDWMLRETFEQALAHVSAHSNQRLAFMSDLHHRVRYHVVRELPRLGKPLSPTSIATALDLSLTQVNDILAELEQNLFFLVRNPKGEVVWAFPVTVAETPHRLTFSSGEQCYGA